MSYNSSAFSGDSLRSGFATAAAQAGASTYENRLTTGHCSETHLSHYFVTLICSLAVQQQEFCEISAC